MKRHYARYTLEKISRITGCPRDKLEAVYKLYASTGDPSKTGTILYAMGQTQHTVGSQNVRALSMVQLLLGNLGGREAVSMPCAGSQTFRGQRTRDFWLISLPDM